MSKNTDNGSQLTDTQIITEVKSLINSDLQKSTNTSISVFDLIHNFEYDAKKSENIELLSKFLGNGKFINS